MLSNLKKLTLVLGVVACCQYGQASQSFILDETYDTTVNTTIMGNTSMYEANSYILNNRYNAMEVKRFKYEIIPFSYNNGQFNVELNHHYIPINYDIIHPTTNNASLKMNKKEQKIIDKLINNKKIKTIEQFITKDQNKRFDQDHFGKPQKNSKKHITK